MDSQIEVPRVPSSAPATGRSDAQEEQDRNDTGEFEEEYPVYRDLVRDIPGFTPYNLAAEELHHMPVGNRDTGWQNCHNSVEKYDRELCQAYREQIDTLLVFAGLFSAVVTAFAVESYQWLQDDPLDVSADLLRDVVDLLSQNLNLTAPPTSSATQRLSPATVARINLLWFLSLSLSLSAALVGILCKQWLREFEHNVGQSPDMALAVRHVRFQGFEFWRVRSIVTSVPIIMQMALALFIIGVVDLLWCLHTVVACGVTVVSGLTLAFYLATTFLPAMQYAYICMRCCIEPLRGREYPTLRAFTEPQCAFKSAQAWLVFRGVRAVINLLFKAYGYDFSVHQQPKYLRQKSTPSDSDSWAVFDINWVKLRESIHVGPRCAFESLAWVAENLGELHMNSWIWHCVWARWLQNRDSSDALSVATTDIESVARSYPRLVPLGLENAALARPQALVLQCSLRTDLPIDTALELLLRVAAKVGVHSQWTREAIRAILVAYHDRYISLSDDIAVSLFRLAESQTYAIILGPEGLNAATRLNGALAFRDVALILHRGTHFRHIFTPAIAGLVLQWLRSSPPEPVAHVARLVFKDTIWDQIRRGYGGSAVLPMLRHARGVILFARLAGAVAELFPEFLREDDVELPGGHAIFKELLAICSGGIAETSQHHLGEGERRTECVLNVGDERSEPPRPEAPCDPHPGDEGHAEPDDPFSLREGGSLELLHEAEGTAIEPSLVPVVGAQGECFNTSTPDGHGNPHAGDSVETHTEPVARSLRASRTSEPHPQLHLCLDVRVEADIDAAETAVGVTCHSSPVTRPTAPASLPRPQTMSPISSESTPVPH